jgi:tetratricopeptide (TPR) repeat protein
MRYLNLLLLLVITCSFATAQKKKTPAASLAAADSAFLATNYAKSIPLYESALKDAAIAKVVQPWYRLGQACHNTKDYSKALAAYAEAEKINGRLPGLRLNMARAFSASGDVANAKARLDSIVVTGFGNHKLLASDPELENLRKTPGYKAIENQAYANSHPCLNLAEARLFDFWLGEWNVFVTANMSVQAGINRVTRESGGCVILENWESQGPHSGLSLNYFDPSSNKWQQKWAGSGQDILEFYDGVYSDSAMRFKWDGRNQDGTKFMGRLTFTNMESGNVRQHSERSDDEGKTWTSVYDFTYVRVKKN